MNNRTKIRNTILILLSCLSLTSCRHQTILEGLNNPFFAMDTGTNRKQLSAKEQVEMLKELGYSGIGYTGTDGIDHMLKELDVRGLKMFAVYLSVRIDPGSKRYDPRLKEAIKQLKGSDALLWLTVNSNKHKPSCVDGDPFAVEIIREIADMAAESNLKVALYPHITSWVERVEDAVRVTEKVNRKNVGVTFNLCHWLKLDDEKNMKPLMELAMPYLFVVTINGADRGDTNKMGWDRLIQTLDRGSFDNYKFLKTLKELGYTGPIGLQGYGIKTDSYENLKRSMNAWRTISQLIAADKNQKTQSW